MKDENGGQDALRQVIEELVARGWRADALPPGLELDRDFPAFTETLNSSTRRSTSKAATT